MYKFYFNSFFFLHHLFLNSMLLSNTGTNNRDERGDLIFESKKSRINDKQSSLVRVNEPLITMSVPSLTHSSTLNKSIPPFRKMGRPKLDKSSKTFLIFSINYLVSINIILIFVLSYFLQNKNCTFHYR